MPAFSALCQSLSLLRRPRHSPWGETRTADSSTADPRYGVRVRRAPRPWNPVRPGSRDTDYAADDPKILPYLEAVRGGDEPGLFGPWPVYSPPRPGADRHHVEGLADAIETAGTEPDATQAQPLPASKQIDNV